MVTSFEICPGLHVQAVVLLNDKEHPTEGYTVYHRLRKDSIKCIFGDLKEKKGENFISTAHFF